MFRPRSRSSSRPRPTPSRAGSPATTETWKCAPQSATLTFDLCPATAACSYAGAVVSQAGGSTVFSFLVPRTAQAAGAEIPMAVTVKAQDVAGNQAQGTGSLKIDDAPPQIGAFTVISNGGVNGEDGKTWFL